tara:strand:- start:7152 stop:7709 length:558 start_codon:yes stop_codon:yes gene_type:complete
MGTPEQCRKYYKENKMRISLGKRLYYNRNKQNILSLKRDYYEENRDLILSKMKKHYGKNKDKYKKSAIENYRNNKDKIISFQRKRRKAIRSEWIEILKIKKMDFCSECGYDKSLAAIDYHHVNPETKKHNIARILKLKPTQERIDELDKCIALCSNCHRELHHSEGEHYGSTHSAHFKQHFNGRN